MSEPMTDDDLVNILDRVACRYVFRDEDTGEMWIDGGALQRVDVEALLAEVRRLRAEQTVMLEALEAAQVLADLDTWSWEDRQGAVGEWDDRIARVRDLFGGAV